jgi:hypothetical protein
MGRSDSCCRRRGLVRGVIEAGFQEALGCPVGMGHFVQGQDVA